MREGTRPDMVFRGSRRRLRQIRVRDNWSVEMWWLAIWVVLVFCLLGRLTMSTGDRDPSTGGPLGQPTISADDRR